MTKKNQWEIMLERTLSRIKSENKAVFSDLFNSDGNIGFLEAEELISSIKTGIGKIKYDFNEFNEVYENLCKEYPEFMDGKKSITG